MRTSRMLLSFVMTAIGGLEAPPAMSQDLTTADVLKLPVPPFDHRLSYGAGPLQFGHLRLAPGKSPAPVAIIIHGGCWLSEFNLDHISTFAAALTRAGFVTWTFEYRRVGDPGGGWPGTFQDVSRGVDFVREIARTHPLDLNRVVVIGHSAGGHLALWVAARRRLAKDSPLYSRKPLAVRGVVALAPVPDLRRAAREQVCDGAVVELLGGLPSEQPARYAESSPIALLPLGVPQRILHGRRDNLVPLGLSAAYAEAAKTAGDEVELTILEDAGHFELIVPDTKAWPAVQAAAQALVKPP